MFRIRRIYDNVLPTNRETVPQVQNILRSQFGSLSEKEIRKIPDQLQNPLKYCFRSILFVAEGPRGHVDGFALVSHAPFLNFCYLDFMAAAKQKMGGGIGGAFIR